MKFTSWKTSFLFLILSAVIAGFFVLNQSRESKLFAIEVTISNIEVGLEVFRLDMKRYPSTEEGLLVLYEKPKTISFELWKGPYLKKIPKDLWQQNFRYIYPSVRNKNSFDLFSIGRDGIEGTIDDINNWDKSKPWVEHYQKLKSWYWSDLLKSWYWYDLWYEYWFPEKILLISVLFVVSFLAFWIVLALLWIFMRFLFWSVRLIRATSRNKAE